MSPKSLLRDNLCISDITALTGDHRFQETIDDTLPIRKVKKALFCTGQIYYELLRRRTEYKREDIALIRIEQLYPFAVTQMNNLLEKYKKTKLIWVQEEPQNMGAWTHINNHYPNTFEVVSRPASASVATGYKKVHDAQVISILQRCFE